MGLFSFVKNAGAKLFGRKKKEAPQVNEQVQQEAEQPFYTQEELNSLKSDELIALVQSLGLQIDSLYVAVEDDVATIAGTAPSLMEKEKAILAIGNVEGIAQVDDKIKVQGIESEEENASVFEKQGSVFHTVEKGDTLSKISKKYYGNPMKYTVIFEANKPMLTDPDLIYAGQVLRIPSLDA